MTSLSFNLKKKKNFSSGNAERYLVNERIKAVFFPSSQGLATFSSLTAHTGDSSPLLPSPLHGCCRCRRRSHTSRYSIMLLPVCVVRSHYLTSQGNEQKWLLPLCLFALLHPFPSLSILSSLFSPLLLTLPFLGQQQVLFSCNLKIQVVISITSQPLGESFFAWRQQQGDTSRECFVGTRREEKSRLKNTWERLLKYSSFVPSLPPLSFSPRSVISISAARTACIFSIFYFRPRRTSLAVVEPQITYIHLGFIVATGFDLVLCCPSSSYY